MSTTTALPDLDTRAPARAASSVDAKPSTVGRVIRSEWIKLRSLRSTWIMLGSLAAAIIAFGLISASVATGSVSTPGGGPGFADASPLDTVLSGANFGILIVAVMGVLVGAREYASGLIRTSIAVVPRRWPLLLGKLVTFVGVLLPTVLVSVLVSFFAGTAILSAAGVASVTWGTAGVAGAVLGTVGYLVGIGVIGVCLGILLRSVGSGLGVLIGGILFVPTLLSALLPESWDSILKYLPSNAGMSFTSVATDSSMLGYGAGLAVFVAWVVLAVGGALWSLTRRDA
jgi:ABC-type transport system involved in multi-copper enzyme maturation permease subunit